MLVVIATKYNQRGVFVMKKLIPMFIIIVAMLVAVTSLAESVDLQIKLDSDQYAVYIGKQIRINAQNANGEVLKHNLLLWTSSDETIAKVNPDGTVKGLAPGEATITATLKNDEAITNSVKIYVRTPVKTITIEPVKVDLLVGSSNDKAISQLSFSIDPDDAYDKTVIWTSSNEKVATVNENGLVTAHSKGSANIIATSTDPTTAKKASVKINVGQAVSEIEINPNEVTIPINKSVNIRATISPKDATNKSLVWSSANDSIASVSANGTIKGISVGNTVITAEAKDGSGIQATCKVTVVSPVKKVTLSETKNITMPIGIPYSLTAVVEPEDASIKDIVWSSSNEKVATVDENGIVTGIALGNAKITASTIDGSNVKASVSFKFEEFDLVFTNRSSKKAKYYYGSGRFNVKGKVKNGCVSISDVSTSMWAVVMGGYASNEFDVTPEKPGIDEINISAGRVKTKIKVYVSPDAFESQKP